MPAWTEPIRRFWLQLPPAAREVLAQAFSLGTGLLAALVLYYVLYRINLPTTPFIYVAF